MHGFTPVAVVVHCIPMMPQQCADGCWLYATGQKDPGAPSRKEDNRQRTYKTKEEVEKTKPVYVTVVAALLLIAFIVPMLQYFGYTRNF